MRGEVGMASNKVQKIHKPGASDRGPIFSRLIQFILLVALDIGTVWFLIKLADLGYFPLAAAVLIIAIFVNVVLLRKKAYPIRWMLVGLVFMGLFTIYPIVFTVWVAFTNYGESHLITKQQAIDQILNLTYLPETGKAYSWTADRKSVV